LRLRVGRTRCTLDIVHQVGAATAQRLTGSLQRRRAVVVESIRRCIPDSSGGLEAERRAVRGQMPVLRRLAPTDIPAPGRILAPGFGEQVSMLMRQLLVLRGGLRLWSGADGVIG
jgi:hypothetical protein